MNKFCKLIGYWPEPTFFLFNLMFGVYAVVGQAFLTYRLCLLYRQEHSNIGDDWLQCSKTKNYTGKELVQAQAAIYSTYSQISSCLPSLIASLFLGVWSDTHGRKPPMLISLVGFTVQGLLMLLLASFDQWPLWLMFVGNVFVALTGHVIIFYACLFSIITDTVKDRNTLTIRLGFISGLGGLAVFIGSLIAGEIDKVEDRPFVYNFLLITWCTAMAMLYGTFFISETIHLRVKKDSSATTASQEGDIDVDNPAIDKDVVDTGTDNHAKDIVVDDRAVKDNDSIEPTILHHDDNIDSNIVIKPKSKKSSTISCTNFIVDFFRILIMPRKGRIRLYLNLSILCLLLTFAGMGNIQYLYLTSNPFNFTDTSYSYQVAIQTSLASAGVLLLPYVFKHILKLEADTWLLLFGLLFSIAKNFLLAFAYNDSMIFITSTLSFGSALLFPGYRAFCSKLVNPSESARLFSLLSSVELLGPLLSGLTFNEIYASTLVVFPGFVWLVAGTMLSFVFVIIGWIHIDYTKSTNSTIQNVSSEEDLLDSD